MKYFVKKEELGLIGLRTTGLLYAYMLRCLEMME